MSFLNFQPKTPEQKFLEQEFTAYSRIEDHVVQVGLGESENYIPVPESFNSAEDSPKVAKEINQEISGRLEELVDVIDEYVDYMSTHDGMGLGDREIVKPWNDLYNHYIARASRLTGDDYAQLNQSTKDVLQTMNRCKQVRHMQAGSTVFDQFGSVLSEAETTDYIEDFCNAFENSLQSNGIELQLDHPKGIGAINSLPNMVYYAIDALHLEKDADKDGDHIAIALQQTVKPFIQAPRQRLAAAIGQKSHTE